MSVEPFPRGSGISSSSEKTTPELSDITPPGEVERAAEVSIIDLNEERNTKPLGSKRFMVLVAMSFLWTTSQIPIYLYGGVIPVIVKDLGGGDRSGWVALSNYIPLAAITPFVGQLSDLLGRRNLSLGASVVVIVGNIVCATVTSMNNFIGGMAIIGFGAGILELVALAVVGEIAPVQSRGLYIAGVSATVLPYAASVLYAQLVSVHDSWRWLGLWIGGSAFIGLVVTAIFFHPPQRPATGQSRKEILQRIDYIGGILSTTGVTLFLIGLTWAGGQYSWRSAHVLAPFIIGLALIIAFLVWEASIAPYPIIPARLRRNFRAVASVLVVTAFAGANFFTILICWPTQFSYMYADDVDPVSIGLGSLPISLCVLSGSIIALVLVSLIKSKVKHIIIISCIVMTAGNGAMAAANLRNVNAMYAVLVLTCLGLGAVIIPCQILMSIIAPDDLIATAIALAITVRMLGGAIGYAIFYSVQAQKFSKVIMAYVIPAAASVGITDLEVVGKLVPHVAAGSRDGIYQYVQAGTQVDILLRAGRLAYAASYPFVYYISVAFGGAAIIAACFIPDLSYLLDNHVAVDYF